ncbi:MAG: hypothetical protein KVP17_005310 [Porospora cf. gigantea B]|uniref:uncharacterized protein n=1 Tax=Porospora cf. gigantea B TaxID=2853592 RepID=UPI003571C6D2|nr:MAG: hypothetical protein KVP17_005310 [Porospora cf. gigantea B]
MGLRHLNQTQQDSVNALIRETGVSQADALTILTNEGWRLGATVDKYFCSLQHEYPCRDARQAQEISKMLAVFKKLGAGPGVVGGVEVLMLDEDGIGGFLASLDLSFASPVVLALMFHCQASTQGVLTFSEFLRGMRSLSRCSVQELRQAVPLLCEEMANPDSFVRIYRYTYTFSLCPPERALPADVAADLWELLLPPWTPLASQLAAFTRNEGRMIVRDVWNMVLQRLRLRPLLAIIH